MASIVIKTVLQVSQTKGYSAESFSMVEEQDMLGHLVMVSVMVVCLLVVKTIMERETVKSMD